MRRNRVSGPLLHDKAQLRSSTSSLRRPSYFYYANEDIVFDNNDCDTLFAATPSFGRASQASSVMFCSQTFLMVLETREIPVYSIYGQEYPVVQIKRLYEHYKTLTQDDQAAFLDKKKAKTIEQVEVCSMCIFLTFYIEHVQFISWLKAWVIGLMKNEREERTKSIMLS